MRHLMSNRKQILKGRSGAGRPLPRLVPFRLRRRLHATSSNGSLEYTGNPHQCRRHRHLTVGVEHDELLVRTIAAGPVGSLAFDQSISSLL